MCLFAPNQGPVEGFTSPLGNLRTLLKEYYVFLIQSKVRSTRLALRPSILKELLGGFASRATRHDVPSNCRSCQFLQLLNPFCLILEQTLSTRQSNIEATLGFCRAQPRALSTRHQDNRNLASTDGIDTLLPPPLRLSGIVDRRGEAAGR